jgi:putative transposase
MTKRSVRRAKPGRVLDTLRRLAIEPNDVWTVDFKGWFRTANGQRVCALTVRDLATRYVLVIQHVERGTERRLRAIFTRLFKRYGLPRAIRSDNGPPFGGEGPRGWTSLSVWWAQLGIEVEHGRPACPQDNAEHEQMHQVLHKETATPAAPTRAAQQRRFDRWRNTYNRWRPHQSLGMHPPIAMYRRSTRCLQLQTWPTHHPECETKQTDPRGRIHWRSHPRHIGRAFANQIVALKTVRRGVVEVYFGPHLLGELHANDSRGIRSLLLRPTKTRRGG